MAFLSSEWGFVNVFVLFCFQSKFLTLAEGGVQGRRGRGAEHKDFISFSPSRFQNRNLMGRIKRKNGQKIKRGWGLFITTGLLVWKKGDSVIFFPPLRILISSYWNIFRFQSFSRQNLNINMTWATGKKTNLNSGLREEGEWGAERTLSD